MTLTFDRWPWKIIGNLCYVTSSVVHHFIAICEFKMEFLSGNAKFGSKSTIIFSRVTLKFDRWLVLRAAWSQFKSGLVITYSVLTGIYLWRLSTEWESIARATILVDGPEPPTALWTYFHMFLMPWLHQASCLRFNGIVKIAKCPSKARKCEVVNNAIPDWWVIPYLLCIILHVMWRPGGEWNKVISLGPEIFGIIRANLNLHKLSRWCMSHV